MKTAHRKQAKVKRKWRADPSAIYRVMSRTQPYTQAEQAHMSLPARLALQSITQGKGTIDDLDTIAMTVNTALVLSEITHPECVKVCLDAAAGTIAAKSRWRRLHRVGFDGTGLEAVRNALDLHEQYLQHISPAQHCNALREVMRRIDAGKFLEESAA